MAKLSSKHDPMDSLADVLDNADRIERYLANVTRSESAANGMLRDALERCLERVCEAVYRRGSRGTEFLPDQPLVDIRGMGNRLRHAYDRVSEEVVWTTTRKTLPSLVGAARTALAQLTTAKGSDG